MLVATLCYSRLTYIEFSLSQHKAEFYRLVVNALTFFGGSPRASSSTTSRRPSSTGRAGSWDLYARFESEIQKNPGLAEKREGVLHQIEGGSHPVASLAKELATKIVQAHLETVAQLSIFYDLLNWESDIIRRGFWSATFELMKEKGALRFEKEGPNEGCWVVPFGGIVETSEGVKSLDKILVRSNGSVTYTGKDIAYQLWKFGLLKRDFLYRQWGTQTEWRRSLDNRS